MKTQILYLAILLFVAVSCQDSVTESKIIDNTKKELQVEKKIIDFVKTRPHWHQNDVVQDKVCDTLTKELLPLVKQGLYDDMPFKFEAVQEYVENGKKGYLALFNFDKDRYPHDRMPNNFLLSLMGIVNEKMVDTLKQGATYYVKGEFLKFKSEKFYLFKESYNNLEIGDVLLPTIRLKVTDVKKYKQFEEYL